MKSHAILIDSDGNYIDLYNVVLHPPAPAEGERIVDAPPPSPRPFAGAEGFIKPRWDGSDWIEGATVTEIAAWEAGHPAPDPPGPTDAERLAALEAAMLAVMGVYHA